MHAHISYRLSASRSYIARLTTVYNIKHNKIIINDASVIINYVYYTDYNIMHYFIG